MTTGSALPPDRSEARPSARRVRQHGAGAAGEPDRVSGLEPQGINLFSMNADGPDLRRVTQDSILEEDPTWSPDGRRIAFAATLPRDVRRDLYVVNLDGSGLTKLLPNGADNRQPEWSPDGRRIAFQLLPGERSGSGGRGRQDLGDERGWYRG
jgi:dipeptidyl aminopeptidase/acylaminoacyl peptidase